MLEHRSRPVPRQRERRFTRHHDFEGRTLSPEALALLTEELREATGHPDAEIPEGRHRSPVEQAGRWSPGVADIVNNRRLLLVTFLTAIVVGAIISIVTGWFGALLIALAVHAVATLIVAAGVIQLTGEVEHVSPETAARLEAEGVADPDRLFTDILLEEAASAERADGARPPISSGARAGGGRAPTAPR
ncbi:MAG TPA: hypothetical protein VFG42_20465 [Baekduia sp.]|uniref:hypothetical protein n=1 Tax=Baekduia sp. TaxID=2600305 RepID=UPI002D782FB3|nr:hypothetical protein [Baekduia sp.]HET6509181.1 hypothetical protein [Baekduia sp.]